MSNLERWISFGMLLNLNQKCNNGQNVNKDELHTIIECFKRSHDHDVDENRTLTVEQKEKRKQLYSKTADAVKDYIEQCLRDENRLNE